MFLADSQQVAIRRSLLPVLSAFLALTDIFIVGGPLTCFLPIPNRSRFGDRSYQFYLPFSTKTLHTAIVGCVKFLALTDIFIVGGQLTCFLPIPNRSRFGDRSYQFYLPFSTKTLHTAIVGCVKYLALTDIFIVGGPLTCFLPIPNRSRFGDRSYQFYLPFSTKTLHTAIVGCVKYLALTDIFIVGGPLTCFLPIPNRSRFGDRSYQFYLPFSTKTLHTAIVGCVKYLALTDIFIVGGPLTCFLPIPNRSRFGDRSYQFYLPFSTKTLHTAIVGCVKYLALTDIFIVGGQLTCFLPIPNRSRFGDRSDRFSVHILPNTGHTPIVQH